MDFPDGESQMLWGKNFRPLSTGGTIFGNVLRLDFLGFLEPSTSRISHDWLFFYLDYDRGGCD